MNLDKKKGGKITVPQENPGASEGLLIAVKLEGSTTRWPTKFCTPMTMIEDTQFSEISVYIMSMLHVTIY